MPRQSAGTSILLVVAIAGVAVVLSLISYQYSTLAAAQVLDLAAQDARSNAELQAHHHSAVIGGQIEAVADNLEIIADATLVQSQEIEGASPLFVAAQGSTSDITRSYGWLDKDGKVLWSTNFGNATLREQFVGTDFSFREYYLTPKSTLQPYTSTLIDSIDGVPRLYISHPILGDQNDPVGSPGGDSAGEVFKGVLVASIDIDTLGELVRRQLSQDYESSVGLMDRNGVILYSSSTSEYIGKNIFDPEIQSRIPQDMKEPFNRFITDSLTGRSGSGDFTTQGNTSTLAYETVRVRGNDFAVLYIVTSHELAGNAASFIEQQRTVNVITTAAIGSVSAGIAAIVLVWNRRLTKVVAARTAELEYSNESLKESNKQLQVANAKLMEANEQLQVHDRLQREFVNVAAHELRTPIQPLLAAAELIESQFHESDRIEITRPEIEMMLRNAKRLERLSSDILDISQIESGAMKLKKEIFSLAYIIADAVKDAKSQSNFDPTKLTVTYYADDIFVYADKDKISQVVSNLLTNAIKFTKAGTITIRTQRNDSRGIATISIKDTGTGIDPEIEPKLFEKFVTRSEKGTGIGLYISKKIVEAHGGVIAGQNNLRGAGATFTFTLPLANTADVNKGELPAGNNEV